MCVWTQPSPSSNWSVALGRLSQSGWGEREMTSITSHKAAMFSAKEQSKQTPSG